MGIFDAIKQRLHPSINAYEEWRGGLAGSFAAMAYKQDFFAHLLKGLPSETAQELSARMDTIEARAFEFWLPSYALRRSMHHIPQKELYTILDMGYAVLYRHLIGMGITESTIMQMQYRLGQRSVEYDAAADIAFLTNEDNKNLFQFGRVVTSHVFQEATENFSVAMTIHVSASATMTAIAQTVAKVKPPSR